MFPIALFLLLLTGVGPLLAWRKTSFDALRRNFAWPLAGGIVAGVVGVYFWLSRCLLADLPDSRRVRDADDCLGIFPRRARDLRARRLEIFTAVGELTMRNTRRYGGYVVHFGMVLIFIGIAGTPFNQRRPERNGDRRHAAYRSVHDPVPEFRRGG